MNLSFVSLTQHSSGTRQKAGEPLNLTLGMQGKFMAENSDEIKRREKAALEAIRQAYGTEVDEHGATLFVSHHLTEINSNYW